MPRLRYMKDWLWEENDVSETSVSDTIIEPPSASSNEVYEDNDGNRASGASWWSNAVIIASLDTTKLHQAYVRYREMARMCQLELIARETGASAGAGTVSRSRSDKRSMRRVASAQRGSGGSATRLRTSRSTKAQLALTPEQMLQALDALTKLKHKE